LRTAGAYRIDYTGSPEDKFLKLSLQVGASLFMKRFLVNTSKAQPPATAAKEKGCLQ
jgi:hypothetical protein